MKNALKIEHELLLTLITHTQDFIYIKDRSSKFLLCNMATAKLMGAAHPDELLNKTDFDFYPQDLAARYYRDEQEIIRTGQHKLNYDEPVIDPEGRTRYIFTTKVPFKDQSGQIIGIVGIGKDITERKKTDEILKRDKDTLEKLAHERAEQLVAVQMQLEQAKRLSDIGTLAATVAHELRNPLASIRVVLANIKRRVKDPVLDGYLQVIEKKIFESDQIIDNLLFYTRLKSPYTDRMSINEIVRECLDVLRGRSEKGIVINNRFSGMRDITIEADSIQLREVIHNILNNAHDALPDAGGVIEVDGEDDGDWIHVYISDNGGGMAQEDLEKAFEPFYTTKARGTGLGLAVCRHIIGQHGGSINLESSLGRGTRAVIKLPKARKAQS